MAVEPPCRENDYPGRPSAWIMDMMTLPKSQGRGQRVPGSKSKSLVYGHHRRGKSEAIGGLKEIYLDLL